MAAFIDGEVVLAFFGDDTVIILATIPAVPAVLTEDVVRHQSALGSAPIAPPALRRHVLRHAHASGATNAAATNLRHVIHSFSYKSCYRFSLCQLPAHALLFLRLWVIPPCTNKNYR